MKELIDMFKNIKDIIKLIITVYPFALIYAIYQAYNSSTNFNILITVKNSIKYDLIILLFLFGVIVILWLILFLIDILNLIFPFKTKYVGVLPEKFLKRANKQLYKKQFEKAFHLLSSLKIINFLLIDKEKFEYELTEIKKKSYLLYLIYNKNSKKNRDLRKKINFKISDKELNLIMKEVEKFYELNDYAYNYISLLETTNNYNDILNNNFIKNQINKKNEIIYAINENIKKEDIYRYIDFIQGKISNNDIKLIAYKLLKKKITNYKLQEKRKIFSYVSSYIIFNPSLLNDYLTECSSIFDFTISNKSLNSDSEYPKFVILSKFITDFMLFRNKKHVLTLSDSLSDDFRINLIEEKIFYGIYDFINVWKYADLEPILNNNNSEYISNFIFDNDLLIYSKETKLYYLFPELKLKQNSKIYHSYVLNDASTNVIWYKYLNNIFLYENGKYFKIIKFFKLNDFFIIFNHEIQISYFKIIKDDIKDNYLYTAIKTESKIVFWLKKVGDFKAIFNGSEIIHIEQTFFSIHSLVYDFENDISIYIENFSQKEYNKIYKQEILSSNFFWYKENNYTIYIYKGVNITNQINSNNRYKCKKGKIIEFNNLIFILPKFELQNKGTGITYKTLTAVERMYDLDKKITKKRVLQYFKSIFPDFKYSDNDKELENFLNKKSNELTQLIDIDIKISLNIKKIFDYICETKKELTAILILTDLLNE